MLTFTNRSPVHYPDQGRTIFTVGGDAVLGRLKNVPIVLFHLRWKRFSGEKKSWMQSAAKQGARHGLLSNVGFYTEPACYLCFLFGPITPWAARTKIQPAWETNLLASRLETSCIWLWLTGQPLHVEKLFYTSMAPFCSASFPVLFYLLGKNSIRDIRYALSLRRNPEQYFLLHSQFCYNNSWHIYCLDRCGTCFQRTTYTSPWSEQKCWFTTSCFCLQPFTSKVNLPCPSF